MNIHIIGAGSLGLLYAGKLADSGCRVTLWCRSEEQADKLRASGITIEEPGRQQVVDAHALSVSSWSSFAESGGRADADYLFLMLKRQRDRRDGNGDAGSIWARSPQTPMFSERYRPFGATSGPAADVDALRCHYDGRGQAYKRRLRFARRSRNDDNRQNETCREPNRAFSQEDHENKLVKQLNRAGFEAFCRMKWMR